MQYEIFKTVVFVALFTFSTYAFSKALWIFGFRGKIKSFGKLWGAVSFAIGGIATAIGLIILSRTF